MLFDGVCVFCNGSVRWLAARDPHARLRFAPLQGETAAALRTRHPEIPEALETFVYFERDRGAERVYLRSSAALRVLAQLAQPWPLLARALAWIPAPLRDLAYGAFARRRYRLFGRLDTCPIPTPEWKARFLP